MARLAAAINGIPASLDATLLTLTRGGADAVPGADHASISIRWRDVTLETVAATDPLIEALDVRQFELREGPCYDAAVAEPLTVSENLARDHRWLNYESAVGEDGAERRRRARSR
jgi:hypothetical protein